MKTLSPIVLLALGSALAQAGDAPERTLTLPSMEPTSPKLDRGAALPSTALQSDGEKKAQIWAGIGALAYERFVGDKAGDEFGFTPTGFLGYQRNFYPGGRLTNGVGYCAGVGLVALGAGVFYHQGSASRTDFRVGIAVNFIYFNGLSYFDSNFGISPFVAWGVKV